MIDLVIGIRMSSLARLGCALLASSSAACGSRSGLEGLLESEEPRAGLDAPPELVEEAPLEPEESETVEETGCVDLTRSYTSLPPTVMLLIDQSGSMAFPFGGSTRWDVLRDAIVAPDDGLLAWLAPTASIGLMFYTSIDGYQGGLACPLLTALDAQFENEERLRATYFAAEPIRNGDTPTGDSIDQAVFRLNAEAPGTPKYILLITDGDPDTCAQPDPQNGFGEAIAAARRAFDQGVTLRAVGMEGLQSSRGLQAMANAGAGKEQSLQYGRDEGAERPLFASTDPRELADQLKGVIGDVRTCSVELGTSVRSRRALDGRIVLDGTPLRFGALDGWTFADEDTLQIHGASCDRILSDGETLSVRFPCESEPPIR